MGKTKVNKANKQQVNNPLITDSILSQKNMGDDFYKTIVQRALEGFIILSFEGDILDANEAFCKMHCCGREELLHKKIYSFGCDENFTHEDYIKLVEGHKKSGGAIFETRHKCKNGKIIDVLVSSKYLDIGGGLFLSFHTDITKQKETLQKLKESEDKYRTLIELGTNIGEAVIMLQDTDGKEGMHVFASDQWPRITGYTKKELLEMSFFELVSPDDRELSLKRHRSKTSGKAIPDLFEMSITHKNGTLVPVEITSAINMHKGKPTNVVYIRDITQRKEMEKEKERDLQELSLIIDSSPIIVFYKDKHGRFIRINKSFSEALNMTEDKLLGKTVFDLYSADIAQSMTKDDEEVLKTGQPKLNIVEQYESINGIKWVQTDKIPIFDKYGASNGLIGFAQDITARKEAEEVVYNYKEHLEDLVQKRTNELQEQIAQNLEFSRTLVHELKTPLTTLLASSDLLVENIKDESLMVLAEHIQRGVLNLDRRINDILDLAKDEVGMLQLDCNCIDIVHFLQQVSEFVAPKAAKKKQKLITDLPSEKYIVWGDQDRLQQVVLNLLDNAFKFTPDRGKIIMSAEKTGSIITVRIQDNGCGIIAAKQKLLFKPYYSQAKVGKNISGFGLGLTLAKSLIQLHNGKIWAKSDGKRGSTFCFSLPIVEKELKNKKPEGCN